MTRSRPNCRKTERRGFQPLVTRKLIYFEEKSNSESITLMRTIFGKIRSLFSSDFFISLPLFALILKLLYEKKQFLCGSRHLCDPSILRSFVIILLRI
jgi:hypothetical protein